MHNGPVFAAWALSAAHVAVFGAAVRWRAGSTGGLCGALFVSLAAAAGAVPVVACLVSRRDDEHLCGWNSPHSLTVSRLVAESPWCAMFAVALCGGAALQSAALADAGEPLTGSLLLLSVAAFSCFPDKGALFWPHSVFLVAVTACLVSTAVRARFGRRVGAAGIAVFRAHITAALVLSAMSTFYIFEESYGPPRLAGLITESAALLHSAAAFI